MEQKTPKVGNSLERFGGSSDKKRDTWMPSEADFRDALQIGVQDAAIRMLDSSGLKSKVDAVARWIEKHPLDLSEKEREEFRRYKTAVYSAFGDYTHASYKWEQRAPAMQRFRDRAQEFLRFAGIIEGQSYIKQFFLEESIHPLTPQEIQKKNDYFDQRYTAVVESKTRHRAWKDDESWDWESQFQVLIAVHKKTDITSRLPGSGDHYYLNGINLEHSDVEGWDNEGHRDEEENGSGRMHLSDIKYRVIQEVMQWLSQTKHPDFEKYKDLSIHNFQPRSLTGYDITHKRTKEIVLGVIQAYKKEKGRNLTREEHDGKFFFLPGSEEFKQITFAKGSLGKAQLYFLGNYFPNLRCTGIILKIQNETVSMMKYPLDKK
jgi:hypothetical protein